MKIYESLFQLLIPKNQFVNICKIRFHNFLVQEKYFLTMIEYIISIIEQILSTKYYYLLLNY
jgi:hypothetical protein